MSLSTAQARALRTTRDANDAGRGAIPPVGPGCRPYKILVSWGFLERKPNESLHYITETGRAALLKSDGGPVP